MIYSLRDCFYTGIQRTDEELHYMMQQQPPEGQYQQIQKAFGGLLLYVHKCIRSSRETKKQLNFL